MEVKENFDLKKYNTLGVSVRARYFTEINSEEALKTLLDSKIFKENERLFLGGGSNVLFVRDFPGIVILNKLKGTEILKEEENEIFIKAMSGESWSVFVKDVAEKGFWGIENLALIPGTVGGSPVQNIGAYGVEAKDAIFGVEVYSLENNTKRILKNEDCKFGYRESIFKNEAKGKYFISAVIFKLEKSQRLKIEYKAIVEYLKKKNLEIKTPKDIADIVSEIRKSKLPDPSVFPNAGSFFKNVFVTKERFEELKKKFPDLPSFPEMDGLKIPAGWLIESCGPHQGGASWKGYRLGNVGMHKEQALVLVNYGGATGEEIKNFAELIVGSVYEKFGLKLSMEVNLI